MSALTVEEPIDEPENNKKSIFRFFNKKTHSPQASRQIEYRMIGDYILGETLGMGGYSKVKLGIHKNTKQKVALKIMFGDETGKISDSKKKQLKRELNVMKKVKHANVIELIDFYEDGEYPEADGTKKSCIVTVLEFAPGGELFDFLMFTGRFNDEATRTYLYQFLDGLQAMHDVGIAHRDLKPENLLMDAAFTLKIADFGFATEYKLENGTQIMMNTACGTKGYLAPELLKGKKYSNKCDLFAVGIILFTTYAGFPPFQTATDSDWWWDKLYKAWTYFESAKTTEDESQKTAKLQKSKEKFDLFWKAHERSIQFNDEFKDLVLRILHPNPEIRYNISNIRDHKWYKDKTYNKTELKAFMDKRLRAVMKERATKIKKQLEDQDCQSKDNHIPVRGDGIKPEIQKRIEKFDPNDEFNQYLDHINDDTFINTYYQFLTFKEPKEIAALIERVADRVHAKTNISPAQCVTLVRAAVTFDQDQEDDVIIAVKQFVYDGDESKQQNNENIDDNDENHNDNANNNSNDDVKQTDNNANNNNNNINKIRYIVKFKRLQGEPASYKHVVEEFYNAIEIVDVMDISDFELL